jgi:alkanesulfonate monooxygenase SsuD/methylene tetrahydromethanopterin reductase-like flavin-dependent oxidoreductase (luciferase family)
MKIDLLYELQPGTRQDNHAVFEQAIEQIVLADEAGFDTVWMVEHHFLGVPGGLALSNAPEVWLGLLAARTKRIRLGHGCVLLPYQFNHPVRVVERAAMVDHLSNGRLELGMARSSFYEQEGFGIDPAETRRSFEEALKIIPRMFQEEGEFSYQGEFVTIPPRAILPKPVQKPHPPLWYAATSRPSFELAGRSGVGLLAMTIFQTLPELQRLMESYRDAARQVEPVGAYVNNELGVFTLAHCAESMDAARQNQGPENIVAYLRICLHLVAAGLDPNSMEESLRKFGDGDPGNPYGAMPLSAFVEKAARGDWTFADVDEHDMVVLGDPETCIDKLERYAEIGADRVLCLMQLNDLDHNAVMRSIRLFGEHVIPHFSAPDRRDGGALRPTPLVSPR